MLAIGAAVQSLLLPPKTFYGGTIEYTEFNNYVIFRQAFVHLREGLDLYVLYPTEHWDLYKYTPSFAAFFGVFAVLPDALGLPLWNLLNALVLAAGVWYLPRLKPWHKGLALLLVAVETMTALQNEQSNALIAGLLVFAFGFLERKRDLAAALCIASTAFIKLFGVVGFALFLLYPRKPRLALSTIGAALALAAVPLLFITLEQYRFLMDSYLRLLGEDHAASYGLSVMGWLKTWFGMDPGKNAVVLSGIVLFLLPLARWRLYRHYGYRLLILSSVLIWVVIFNHKAESPTFVLALAGAALWFIAEPKNRINLGLMILALLLTSLSATDLFPRALREAWIKPYVLKALPCILIWVKLLWDMLRYPVQGKPGPDKPNVAPRNAKQAFA